MDLFLFSRKNAFCKCTTNKNLLIGRNKLQCLPKQFTSFKQLLCHFPLQEISKFSLKGKAFEISIEKYEFNKPTTNSDFGKSA